MKFSKEILEKVYTIKQLYESHKNDYVEATYPVIEIKKFFKDKELSIRMIYDNRDKTFELQSPTYQYYSKISHYDFKRPEARWTRDKGFLFSLITNLKASGFWDMISNKDFLIVNRMNKNSNPKELLKVLKALEAS